MFVSAIARPSSSRCGHSTSIGATARNSGPGKSPLLPIPDSATASSVAISASRSERSVDVKGSTGTKSTVPAIVVFSPSIGKRVIVRMPDSPAVSFAQLSAFPAPSDVTTPMPVTTTSGLPNLSWVAAMCPRRFRHFNLQRRRIVGGKQCFARDRKRRKRQSENELRFHVVAERRAAGPDREIRMLSQKRQLQRRDRKDAGRAGDDGAIVVELAKFRPKRSQ